MIGRKQKENKCKNLKIRKKKTQKKNGQERKEKEKNEETFDEEEKARNIKQSKNLYREIVYLENRNIYRK